MATISFVSLGLGLVLGCFLGFLFYLSTSKKRLQSQIVWREELAGSQARESAQQRELKQLSEAHGIRLIELQSAQEKVSGELQAISSREAAAQERSQRVPILEAEIKHLREIERDLHRELEGAKASAAEARTELEEARNQSRNMRESLKAEFSEIAVGILEERGKILAENHRTGLETLLKPLGDRLGEFQRKVDEVYRQEGQERASLKTELQMLLQMNQKLGDEARNLSTALRGQSKTRGTWGEMILESVLEKSGLVRGREYEVQASHQDEDGRRFQPDVVVHMPEGRDVVIDAKVSLVAYERYCSAADVETADTAMKDHVASMRAHIEGLARKKYQDLYGLKTLDFVFLFVPVESAFTEAAHRDFELFQKAFDRNVILVSPSTLLASLRTVAGLWRQEYQSRNVVDIVQKAGALHDKFIGFLEDLDGVGNELNKAVKHYESARGKLVQGRGNLVNRVDQLRKLGAGGQKQVPLSFQEGLIEDEIVSGQEENRLPL